MFFPSYKKELTSLFFKLSKQQFKKKSEKDFSGNILQARSDRGSWSPSDSSVVINNRFLVLWLGIFKATQVI